MEIFDAILNIAVVAVLCWQVFKTDKLEARNKELEKAK